MAFPLACVSTTCVSLLSCKAAVRSVRHHGQAADRSARNTTVSDVGGQSRLPMCPLIISLSPNDPNSLTGYGYSPVPPCLAKGERTTAPMPALSEPGWSADPGSDHERKAAQEASDIASRLRPGFPQRTYVFRTYVFRTYVRRTYVLGRSQHRPRQHARVSTVAGASLFWWVRICPS